MSTLGIKQNKKIAIWLFICCLMVAAMVTIGGLTRLTGSGLSMTDWKPITGFIPPLDDAGWDKEFASYKKSPEYLKINKGMNLEGFKEIFWLEFIHRVLGRLAGVVFFVPFLWFIYKKYFQRKDLYKLLGIFFLGGAQGVVGWYMVKSGLRDLPQVSHYWLAFHLSVAFVIFAMLLLMGLGFLYEGAKKFKIINLGSIRRFALFVLIITFVQIIWGGLVAGLDAGLIYNTFPDMLGHWIHPDVFTSESFVHSVAPVQFTHRVLAVLVVFSCLLFWIYTRSIYFSLDVNIAIKLLVLVVLAQFILGVQTLINVVPIHLASAHQVVALVLFALLVYINHALIFRHRVG